MAEDTPDHIAAGQDASPAPPDETEGAEHVEIHHKPHPVHGWREFLKEYAIVVLGVLTALAGEQLVEALRRGHESKATTAALQQEVGVSLIDAAERIMGTDCLKARLTELSDSLNRGGAWRANPLPGQPSQALPLVYRAPTRPWNTTSWQAVLASGSVAHMTEAELRSYGDYYRYIQILSEQQAHELTLVPEVQPLAYDQTLSTDKRFEMQSRLAALERLNSEITSIAGQFIERARRNGFPPDSARLEARFRGLSATFRAAHYGNCVQRLGSTANAFPAATK